MKTKIFRSTLRNKGLYKNASTVFRRHHTHRNWRPLVVIKKIIHWVSEHKFGQLPKNMVWHPSWWSSVCFGYVIVTATAGEPIHKMWGRMWRSTRFKFVQKENVCLSWFASHPQFSHKWHIPKCTTSSLPSRPEDHSETTWILLWNKTDFGGNVSSGTS